MVLWCLGAMVLWGYWVGRLFVMRGLVDGLRIGDCPDNGRTFPSKDLPRPAGTPTESSSAQASEGGKENPPLCPLPWRGRFVGIGWVLIAFCIFSVWVAAMKRWAMVIGFGG